MKKLILTTLIVATFTVACAQTEQGRWVVGVSSNLSFGSTNVDGANDNISNVHLSGQAGYFIMDNLAAGLTLGVGASRQGELKTSSTSIGPFARYYINGVFYVGAGYTTTSGKSKNGSTTTNEFDGGNLLLEAGYPVWLGENVAIEPGLNYLLGTGDINRSTLAATAGFRLYF